MTQNEIAKELAILKPHEQFGLGWDVLEEAFPTDSEGQLALGRYQEFARRYGCKVDDTRSESILWFVKQMCV